MYMDNWTNLLLEYKSDRDPVTLIFLVDNTDAMKVVAAWPYIKRTVNESRLDDLRVCPEGVLDDIGMRTRWEMMWTWVKPDLLELASMTEVSIDKTACIFLTLKNARLIFPDGTVHDQARKIIGNYIAGKVRK